MSHVKPISVSFFLPRSVGGEKEEEDKRKTKSKRKIWNQPQRDESLIAVPATIPYTPTLKHIDIISMFVNILKAKKKWKKPSEEHRSLWRINWIICTLTK